MHAYLWPLSAALLVAAPASALWVPGWEKVDPVVLAGTMEPPEGWNSTSFMISSPGRYRLSWNFDRPLGVNSGGEAEGIAIFYMYGWVLDDYEGGEWVWGTSEEFDDYVFVSSPGSILLEIPEPRIENLDDEGYYQSTYWQFLSGIGLYSSSELDSPLGYQLTLTQVPEPASWAMMIMGFGLVGLAARRRADRPGPATA